MRKLASTQRVLEIKPIENADAIEVAVINGWEVVVKKNSVQKDDIVCYFEIDSWIPHDLAPFLTKNERYKLYQGITGNRLKTVRLRGQLSQGLIIPVDELFKFRIVQEDIDLTDVLNIKKWEKELSASLAGCAKGNFPSFVPKTDEERIQNLKRQFGDGHLDGRYELTEKLDGTSFTTFSHNGEHGVCSRNLELKRSDGNTYWKIFDKYNFESIFNDFPFSVAIQGEIIGPGIQGNQYGLTEHKLFVFKIWNIDKQRYYTPVERKQFCEWYELTEVPVIDKEFTVDHNTQTIQDILDIANSKSVLNDTMREGLIFNNVDHPHIHFKAINNEWLLKYD